MNQTAWYVPTSHKAEFSQTTYTDLAPWNTLAVGSTLYNFKPEMNQADYAALETTLRNGAPANYSIESTAMNLRYRPSNSQTTEAFNNETEYNEIFRPHRYYAGRSETLIVFVTLSAPGIQFTEWSAVERRLDKLLQ